MSEVEAGKFNGDVAHLGYALNRMCYSLNSAENRAKFTADEDVYCTQFGLSSDERAAVRSRSKKRMFAIGGNMYFVAKLDRVPRPADAETR